MITKNIICAKAFPEIFGIAFLLVYQISNANRASKNPATTKVKVFVAVVTSTAGKISVCGFIGDTKSRSKAF